MQTNLIPVLRFFFVAVLSTLLSSIGSTQSCSPASITLNTQTAIDNFKMAHGTCTQVNGYLTIEGDGITNVDSLHLLTSVGSLVIRNCPDLVSLDSLRNLTTISGDFLELNNLPLLPNLDAFSALNTVDVQLIKLIDLPLVPDIDEVINATTKNLRPLGTIQIANCDGLQSADFSGFTISHVYGFSITNNDELISLTMPSAAWFIDGSGFFISDNPMLSTLNLDGLTSVNDLSQTGVRLIRNNLATLNFPNLTSASGLWFEEELSLTTVTLDNLHTITGGGLFLEDLPNLNNSDFLANLTDFNGKRIIAREVPLLPDFSQYLQGLNTAIITDQGQIALRNADMITGLDLSGFTMSDLYLLGVADNAVLESFVMPSTPWSVTSLFTCLFWQNPNLHTINLSGLTSISNTGNGLGLQIGFNVITNLNLSGLASTDGLRIESEHSLTQITASGNLHTIADEGLYLEDLPVLNNAEFLSGLTTFDAFRLSLIDLPSFPDIQSYLNNLTTATIYSDGQFRINNVDAFTELDFSGFSFSSFSIFGVQENDNLVSFAMPSTPWVYDGQVLLVWNNASLGTLDLSGLTTVISSTAVNTNTGLGLQIGFNNLNTLDLSSLMASDGFRLEGEPLLTTLDGVSSLIEINGQLWVQNNPNLCDCLSLKALLDETDDPPTGPGSGTYPDISGNVLINNNRSGCDSVAEVPLDTNNDGTPDGCDLEPPYLQINVVDQYQVTIPNSRVIVDGGVYLTGSQLMLEPGTYPIRIIPGINGLQQTAHLWLETSITITEGMNPAINLEWPLDKLAFELRDEETLQIIDGSSFNTAIFFNLLANNEPITLPRTTIASGGSFANGYVYNTIPGINGIYPGSGTMRREELPVVLDPGNLELTYNAQTDVYTKTLFWKRASITLSLKDPATNQLIPATQLTFRAPPAVNLFLPNPATVTLLPVTEDPDYPPVEGTLTQGYEVITTPGINGLNPGTAELKRDEQPIPLTEDTTVELFWITKTGNLHLLDANTNEEICDAQIKMPANGPWINTGDLISIPTNDPAYPDISGNLVGNYNFELQPIPAGTIEGPYSATISIGGTLSPDPLDGNYALNFDITNGCNECPGGATDNLECHANINVNLDENCQYTLTPEDVLVGEFGCLTYEGFTIQVLNDDDDTNGAIVDGVGAGFIYTIEPNGDAPADINFTNCFGFIEAEDKEAPVAQCMDATVQLDSNGEASLTANQVNNASYDNCSSVSLSVTPSLLDCTNLGSATATLSVTDDAGFTSNCTATITVEDLIAPTLNCPETQTLGLGVNCEAPLPDYSVVGFPVDNCTTHQPTVTQDPPAGTNYGIGTYPVTLTATDFSNNSTSCTFIVEVADEVPLQLNCQDVMLQLDGDGMAMLEGSAIDAGLEDACDIASVVLSETNFDCDDVTSSQNYALDFDGQNDYVNIPHFPFYGNGPLTLEGWVRLDAPLSLQTPKTFTIWKSGTNNTVGFTLDVTYLPNTTQRPIRLITNGSIQNYLNIDLWDGKWHHLALTKNAAGPTILYIDGQAVITVPANFYFAPPLLLGRSSALNVFKGQMDELRLWNVVRSQAEIQENKHHVIAPTPPSLKGYWPMDEGPGVSYIVNAISNGHPGHLQSMNPNTAWVSGVPISYPNLVNMTVTTVSQESATCSVQVDVKDSIPPTAACQDATLQLTAAASTSLSPNLVDAGSTDNCAIESKKLWFSPTAFNCDHIGQNITVTLLVTDKANNTSSCSAAITVADPNNYCCAAPVALCMDYTAQVDANENANIIPAHINAGSSADCGLQNLSVTPNAFDCNQLGAQEVTLTVTDDNNHTATCTASITIADDDFPCCDAPIAICQDYTIQLQDNGGQITADLLPAHVDNSSLADCGQQSLMVSPSTFNCGNVGANVVTLTITDDLNSTSSCTATVAVQDLNNLCCAPPVAVCDTNIPPIQMTGSSYSVVPSDINGGSSAECGIDYWTVISSSQFNCSTIGTHTVTLVITDHAGATSHCSTTITLEDGTAPAIACPANDMVSGDANCIAVLSDYSTSATLTDNCLNNLTVTQVPAIGTSITEPSTTVTLTVTDGTASAECSFEVIRTCDCDADAGDIANSEGSNNLQTDRDTDLEGLNGAVVFMPNYDAGDENLPPAGYQYALLLVNRINRIMQYSIMGQPGFGDFDFSVLPPGDYQVYGLSYASYNSPPSLEDYLTSTIIGLGSSNDIGQIELDDTDNGGLFCLYVDGEAVDGQTTEVTVVPGANDYFWVGGSGDWTDYQQHWATSSGGDDFHTSVPGFQDNVYFDEGSGFDTDDPSLNYVNVPTTFIEVHNMDWTGVTGNPTFQGGVDFFIFGSLTLSSQMNYNYTGTTHFRSSEPGQTIFTGGQDLRTHYFEGVGGEWTLQDKLKGTRMYLNNGTLRTDGHELELPEDLISTSGQTRALYLSNSTLKVRRIFFGTTANSNTYAEYPEFTFDAGTSHIILAHNVLNEIRNQGGAKTFYDITINSGGNNYPHYVYLYNFKNANEIIFATPNTYRCRLTGKDGTYQRVAFEGPTYYSDFGIYGNNMTVKEAVFLNASVYNAVGGTNMTYEQVNFAGGGTIVGNGNTFEEVTFGNIAATISSTNSSFQDLVFNGTATINGTNNTFGTTQFNDAATIGNSNGNSNNTFGLTTFMANGTFFGNNSFDGVSLNPGAIYTLQSGKTQTITASGSVIAAGSGCTALITIQSNTLGQQATLKKLGTTNVAIENVALQDIKAEAETLGAISFTANNSVDLGNNAGWTITNSAPRNLYWVNGTGEWNDPAHWSQTSGGNGGACIPTPADNVYFDDQSFTVVGQEVNIPGSTAYCKDLDWTAVTNHPTFTGTGNIQIHGSLIYASTINMTNNYTGTTHFRSSEPGQTIFTGGQDLRTHYFEGVGGEWTLQDKLKGTRMYLNNGTLRTDGHELELPEDLISTSGQTRALYLSNSTLKVRRIFFGTTANSNTYAEYPEFTFDAGTSHIILAHNVLNEIRNQGGAKTFYDITINSGGNNYPHYVYLYNFKNANEIIFATPNTYRCRLTGKDGTYQRVAFEGPTYYSDFGIYGNNMTVKEAVFLNASVYNAVGGTNMTYEQVNFAGGGTIVGNGNTFEEVTFGNIAATISSTNSSFQDLVFNGTATINGTNNTFGTTQFNDAATIGNSNGNSNNTFGLTTFMANGTFFGNNSFDGVSLNPGAIYTLQSGKTQTITASGSVIAAGSGCTALITIQSNTLGQQATLKKLGTTNVAIENVALQDIKAEAETLGAISFTANNSVDLGNNAGWTITNSAPRNLYWVNGTGEWNDPAHWSQTSGGNGGACIPTPADNVYFDDQSFTVVGQEVNIPGSTAYCKDLDWTAVTNHPTFTGTGNIQIHGSLIYASTINMTNNYTGTTHFRSSEPGQTIFTGGQDLRTHYFEGVGGEWTLQDKLKGTRMYLNNGTLRTDGHELELPEDLISTSGQTRALYLSNSTLKVRRIFFGTTANSNTYAEYPEFTFDAGTSHIILAHNVLNEIRNQGGAKTFYDITINSGGNNYPHYVYLYNFKNANEIIFATPNTYRCRLTGKDGTYQRVAFEGPTYYSDFGIYGNNMTVKEAVFLNASVYNAVGGTNMTYEQVNFAGGGTIVGNGNTFEEVTFGNIAATISSTNSSFQDLVFNGTATINGTNNTFGTTQFNDAATIGNSNGNSNNTFGLTTFMANGTFFGNNSFDGLNLSPAIYILQKGKTQTISSTLSIFNPIGTPGQRIQINSNDLGTQATIYKDGELICGDYLSITDIAIEGTAPFYAGEQPNSSDGGGNDPDILFEECPDCTPYSILTPSLDISQSFTQACPDEYATLVLQAADIGPDDEVVWFNANQTVEFYASPDNNFSHQVFGAITFYGAIRNTLTGCVSDLLPVQVECPCDADAGDLGNSLAMNMLETEVGTDIPGLTFYTDYLAIDETEPEPAASFDYAFVLVNNNGEILQYSLMSDADFDFATLGLGNYSVYGLSYDMANPIPFATFLNILLTMNAGDDIQLVMDSHYDNGGDYCLDIDDGSLDGHTTKISVVESLIAPPGNVLAAPNTQNDQTATTHSPISPPSPLSTVKKASIMLFPNPNNGICYLVFEELEVEEVRVEVFSSTGQRLLDRKLDQPGQSPQRLNLSAFEKGVYFVKVLIPGQEVMVKPVVIAGH